MSQSGEGQKEQEEKGEGHPFGRFSHRTKPRQKEESPWARSPVSNTSQMIPAALLGGAGNPPLRNLRGVRGWRPPSPRRYRRAPSAKK